MSKHLGQKNHQHTNHAPKKSTKTYSPKSKSIKSSQSYFFGVHAVNMLLKRRPHDALSLFMQNKEDGTPTHEALLQFANQLGISVQMAHKDTLTQLCGSVQHQGVVLLARPKPSDDEGLLDELLLKPDVLFLVLDQITDAHNLGACLRSACAMGVDAVIVPKAQSATITPTVAKVSVGASEVVALISTNLARCLDKLKQAGVFVFGTALDDTAKPLYQCDFLGKVAIVMGSEGEGMRRLTREHCDTLVYIPMADTQDRPQSLNVSVATGMMLCEVQRQRYFSV